MITHTQKLPGVEKPHRRLDLQDPIDLAEFQYKLASARGPLPPALRFLMDIPIQQLRIFVEDFAREFDTPPPDEVYFQSWERLDTGNGPGWFAICAYYYFESLKQRGMEFMTYVYARYGRGLPPGTSPSLMTSVKSLWSEDARGDLAEQRKIRDGLCDIRDRVRRRMFRAAQTY